MKRKQLALVLAAFSVIVGLLASGLRPDAFFVGDPGVKLTSTRNATRFPSAPLNIALPRIGNDPTPHLEAFFEVHGDHAHAVTSEFFPLISAPMLAAFGLRGLYVLPALGLVATLAATAWLGVVLDRRRDAALVALLAGLGTPFLFYGLEFWEHTLSLAFSVAGTALLLDAARRPPAGARGHWRPFAAGLLFGVAVVLRVEAGCYAAAVIIATPTLQHQPSARFLAVAVAGAVIVLLPLEVYTMVHFGSIVPRHVATNAAAMSGSWAAGRVELARSWLVPSLWDGSGPLRPSSFWSVAPAAIVALLSAVSKPDREGRRFLWTVALATTALVLLTAPNGGGGQWGPRYLLAAYIPLVLLAGDVVQQVPRRAWRVITVAVLVAVCVWVQRAAYRQLRGTKAAYGRIVDLVADATPAGGYVVTDVWWLDQLAAAALGDRTLLFAGDAATGRDIVRRLSDARAPEVTVVRSRDESADVDAWSDGSCYVEAGREELPVRRLVAVRLQRRCAGP
jgi:hypothetical protein